MPPLIEAASKGDLEKVASLIDMSVATRSITLYSETDVKTYKSNTSNTFTPVYTSVSTVQSI